MKLSPPRLISRTLNDGGLEIIASPVCNPMSQKAAGPWAHEPKADSLAGHLAQLAGPVAWPKPADGARPWAREPKADS